MNAPSMNPNANKTSVTAVIAVVLTLITMPSIFCVVGYGTGALAVLLGVIVLVQYNNGDCNKASAAMGGFSIVVSILTILGYTLLLGGTMASTFMQADNSATVEVEKADGTKTEAPRIEIADLQYGVTEQNDMWWRYAWTARLKNNTARDRSVSVEVKFLTAEGLKVDSDRQYGVQIPANGETTIEGDALVRCPGCTTVANAKLVLD